jgi:hypothetical protein
MWAAIGGAVALLATVLTWYFGKGRLISGLEAMEKERDELKDKFGRAVLDGDYFLATMLQQQRDALAKRIASRRRVLQSMGIPGYQ